LFISSAALRFGGAVDRTEFRHITRLYASQARDADDLSNPISRYPQRQEGCLFFPLFGRHISEADGSEEPDGHFRMSKDAIVVPATGER
jgi:hypothetical protein